MSARLTEPDGGTPGPLIPFSRPRPGVLIQATGHLSGRHHLDRGGGRRARLERWLGDSELPVRAVDGWIAFPRWASASANSEPTARPPRAAARALTPHPAGCQSAAPRSHVEDRVDYQLRVFLFDRVPCFDDDLLRARAEHEPALRRSTFSASALLRWNGDAASVRVREFDRDHLTGCRRSPGGRPSLLLHLEVSAFSTFDGSSGSFP